MLYFHLSNFDLYYYFPFFGLIFICCFYLVVFFPICWLPFGSHSSALHFVNVCLLEIFVFCFFFCFKGLCTCVQRIVMCILYIFPCLSKHWISSIHSQFPYSSFCFFELFFFSFLCAVTFYVLEITESNFQLRAKWSALWISTSVGNVFWWHFP